MSIYLYEKSIGMHEYGLGSAIALVMLLIMLVLSFFYIRQMVRIGEVPVTQAARARQSAGTRSALARLRRDALPGLLDGLDGVQAGLEITSYTPHWIPLHPTLVHFPTRSHAVLLDDAKNSLIVVASSSRSRWCSRSSPRSRSRSSASSGARRFIVLMIAIQMLPANALIIPLYVVLARYHQTDS
jgi:N,N'-diacetylchitobiose transport system permease protein